MVIAIVTFCVLYLLLASGALLLFSRWWAPRKAAAVGEPEASGKQRGLSGTIQHAGASLGGMVGRFEGALPKSRAEVSLTRQRFISAGYRDESVVSIFYGAKVVLMAALLVVALVTGLASFNYFFVILFALAAGFLAPDYWLRAKISNRQKQIKNGLPDVLDLLVICVEAGLSMDQATLRTAQELTAAQPALSDELGVIVMEQRMGCPRSDAWRHFAERTGVESVRNLVTILVQAEQFGTSISKTLRIQSETLRMKRVQQVEERAAKTSVKLMFPLAVFIFPVLFLVTLGPAIILTFESLGANLNH